MEEYNDYEIPFSDMSEEDFLYRVMNEDDPMHMGPEEVPDQDINDDGE